jgi:SAM-dependent methyltransferase
MENETNNVEKSDAYRCLICEATALEEVSEFSSLERITSDCRSFAAGGRLAVCCGCGAVQKYPDSEWLNDIGQIYSGYAAYYQADGDEQIILDSRTGNIRRRSDVIMEQLVDAHQLTSNGRALDIGCGTGVTLSALSKILPGWKLYGQDLDKRNEFRLNDISGFEELLVCDPSDIEGQYDLITLIHSLEHFPSPSELLKSIVTKLAPGGILLVQVCNTLQNPYDLLIADHLTHYSTTSLKLLAENTGYVVKGIETEWVQKELSMIAINSDQSQAITPASSEKGLKALDFVRSQLKWLTAMKDEAEVEANDADSFGIFGTSICATWLAGILGEKIAFFVDEDPSRQGKDYMGKPILSPSQVPSGGKVYMALVPRIANVINKRMCSLDFEVVLPPAYEQG